MFHAEFPAMHSLWWPLGVGALDAILDAFGQAIPDAVPATSGRDPLPVRFAGFRAKTGRRWTDAHAHAVGQGGNTLARWRNLLGSCWRGWTDRVGGGARGDDASAYRAAGAMGRLMRPRSSPGRSRGHLPDSDARRPAGACSGRHDLK